MADMNDTTCSSSSSLAEPDDISLLLRQILFRSSSSSSHFVPQNQYLPNHSVPFTGADRVYAAESSSGLNSSSGVVFSSPGGYIPASGTNVSSSSVGTFDNDVDEYDCESEEGFENLGEEVLVKHVPRNSSKRSRAAEVHNLSEKRRRSRINEKMKALQNLIPNSNKTDKASMLDEAIEYLKQLQLQVQMLTMRNGISLYPMCLPGVVQPNQLSEMRMGFPETSGTGNMNLRGQLPMNQESPITAVFGLPNQCSNPNQPSLTNLTNIINSETSFGLESSVQDHLRAFQLHTSPEEICRGDFLLRQRLTADHSETNQLVLKEFHTGPKAKASDPFATRASNLKDNGLEAGILGRGRPGGVLTNLECDQILSSQLNGLLTGRSFLNDIDDIKSKRLNF